MKSCFRHNIQWEKIEDIKSLENTVPTDIHNKIWLEHNLTFGYVMLYVVLSCLGYLSISFHF